MGVKSQHEQSTTIGTKRGNYLQLKIEAVGGWDMPCGQGYRVSDRVPRGFALGKGAWAVGLGCRQWVRGGRGQAVG